MSSSATSPTSQGPYRLPKFAYGMMLANALTAFSIPALASSSTTTAPVDLTVQSLFSVNDATTALGPVIEGGTLTQEAAQHVARLRNFGPSDMLEVATDALSWGDGALLSVLFDAMASSDLEVHRWAFIDCLPEIGSPADLPHRVDVAVAALSSSNAGDRAAGASAFAALKPLEASRLFSDLVKRETNGFVRALMLAYIPSDSSDVEAL